jgi:low temperature requirement protein LtrA
VRLLLVGIMLASLVMSASLPEAFGTRGLVFAAMYAVMEVARVRGRRATPGQRAPAELPADPDLAGGGGHPLAGRGLRSWAGAGGVLGHGGGRGLRGAAGEVRHARARTLSDDGLDDRRFAHGRSCQLFIIISLGESILVTGTTFGELPLRVATAAAFVVAFASSVALWWIYFYRMAEWGTAVISTASDPGRLGRSAYTYFHVPMVAGIIVTAVADELTIADPGAHGTGAIAALAALVPVALVVPVLVTSLAGTLVIAAVAVWETHAVRGVTLPTATG